MTGVLRRGKNTEAHREGHVKIKAEIRRIYL